MMMHDDAIECVASGSTKRAADFLTGVSRSVGASRNTTPPDYVYATAGMARCGAIAAGISPSV